MLVVHLSLFEKSFESLHSSQRSSEQSLYLVISAAISVHIMDKNKGKASNDVIEEDSIVKIEVDSFV